MSLSIHKAGKFEIFILDSIFQDAYFHHTISRMDIDNDTVLGFFYEKNPVGAAALFPIDETSTEIVCFYLMPDYRELTQEFMNLCIKESEKNGIKALQIRLVSSRPDYENMKKILSKAQSYEKSIICHCNLDFSTKQIWEQIRAGHCQNINSYLCSRGWHTVRFSESGTSFLQQLVQKQNTFDSQYSVTAILNGRFGTFIPELSRMAVYHNHPYAVAMLTKADDSALIFQLISASYECPQSGAFMLAVADTIDSLFLSEYQTVSFCYLKENQQMQQIARRIFSKMAYRVTEQTNYTLSLKKE